MSGRIFRWPFGFDWTVGLNRSLPLPQALAGPTETSRDKIRLGNGVARHLVNAKQGSWHSFPDQFHSCHTPRWNPRIRQRTYEWTALMCGCLLRTDGCPRHGSKGNRAGPFGGVHPHDLSRLRFRTTLRSFSAYQALRGQNTIDRGRVEQTNFNDYGVLRINRMTAIEVHMIPSEQVPTGAGEFRFAGSSGAVPAIFAAPGRRVRRLPIRLTGLSEPTHLWGFGQASTDVRSPCSIDGSATRTGRSRGLLQTGYCSDW